MEDFKIQDQSLDTIKQVRDLCIHIVSNDDLRVFESIKNQIDTEGDWRLISNRDDQIIQRNRNHIMVTSGYKSTIYKIR